MQAQHAYRAQCMGGGLATAMSHATTVHRTGPLQRPAPYLGTLPSTCPAPAPTWISCTTSSRMLASACTRCASASCSCWYTRASSVSSSSTRAASPGELRADRGSGAPPSAATPGSGTSAALQHGCVRVRAAVRCWCVGASVVEGGCGPASYGQAYAAEGTPPLPQQVCCRAHSDAALWRVGARRHAAGGQGHGGQRCTWVMALVSHEHGREAVWRGLWQPKS